VCSELKRNHSTSSLEEIINADGYVHLMHMSFLTKILEDEKIYGDIMLENAMAKGANFSVITRTVDIMMDVAFQISRPESFQLNSYLLAH
jgi:hypothetical protein